MVPSEVLLAVNGVLSFTGVGLLVWVMNERWAAIGRDGNQLWAMCLLGYSLLVAGASAENLGDRPPLGLHHFGTTAMSLALVGAALWTTWKYRSCDRD